MQTRKRVYCDELRRGQKQLTSGQRLQLLRSLVQSSDPAERRAVRLGLGNLHVSALQPRREDVHDLGRHIHDVGVAGVDAREDGLEPHKTLQDVLVERGCNGSGNGERDKRTQIHDVRGVAADEEVVEELRLTWRVKPLELC